jgi:hypothetical protein
VRIDEKSVDIQLGGEWGIWNIQQYGWKFSNGLIIVVGNLRVGNRIRGVSKSNPKGSTFRNASNDYFGRKVPFTGYY